MSFTPVKIDRFAFEEAVRPAVEKFMNALAPDAPPVWWQLSFRGGGPVLSGMAQDTAWRDAGSVAEWWASLLGLDSDESASGIRTLSGRVPGLSMNQVEVWYIADQATFDEAYSRTRTVVSVRESDGAVTR